MTGYPDGAAVEVRYPRTKAEERGNSSAWPWLARHGAEPVRAG